MFFYVLSIFSPCLKRSWIQNNSMTRSVIMTFLFQNLQSYHCKVGRRDDRCLRIKANTPSAFVRKHLSSFIRHTEVPYENVTVLEVCKTLLGLRKNAFIISTYIPLYDSKFWNVTNNGYGLEILEQCIVDLYQNLDEFYLIICGDLNARTGKENYIINDPFLFDKENDDKDELIFERNSDDGEINLFGRQLLEVCKMFDCVILNGLCRGGGGGGGRQFLHIYFLFWL